MRSALQEKILTLVRHHDSIIETTPRAVKRTLARLGGDVELFHVLCDMKRADAYAQAPSCTEERVTIANELERILEQILEADEAFSLKSLMVNGKDVLALGVAPGPTVGKLLDEALQAVIDERVPNEREALLDFLASRVLTHLG